MTRQRIEIEDRVTKEPMSGCWLWMGPVNANGYGLSGHGKLAHRVSYEGSEGEIPKGLDLMHICHNRLCVNPAHLEPGTRQENVMMSVRDGRWNSELRSQKQKAVRAKMVKNGKLYGATAKFSELQIKGIRKLAEFGISNKAIGLSLGVTGTAIRSICTRKAYAYVD